jgi:aspartyl-tRNA(Asn)/glutamyl-tRNA(Gln) amidotransferase subunit B
MSDQDYQIVIGLEVHVQLATKSKLFSRASTQFGAPPNTQTTPICIGMPGTLPVMNREAFRLSLIAAVALNCNIPEFTKWDRKQYYYPDLPKGYQISQFDLPMSEHGHLDIFDHKGRFEPKKVRITRAHLEEDAGKSMHDEVAGKADSRIDLNRTGTPLLEIVSEPDMRSPEEARAYLDELKLLIMYLGVSDCNMQEGSLRVDANVNLHIETTAGKIATPIVEIKNMNSFRAVERAIAYESKRQYQVWKETGRKIGEVAKVTRGWDDQAQITKAQREKEDSSDYRYFPDPDLVPIVVTSEEVEEIRAALGELPAAMRARLQETYKIPPFDADVIVNQGRELVQYFEDVAQAAGDGKRASNWVLQDVLRTLNDREITVTNFPVDAAQLADLVKLVAAGDLDNTRAKDVFAVMLENGISAEDGMKKLGIEKVDQSEIITLCEQLLAANPKVVADVKGGNDKAIGALIGQAKSKNPNANPGEVRKICLELIANM